MNKKYLYPFLFFAICSVGLCVYNSLFIIPVVFGLGLGVFESLLYNSNKKKVD